MCFFFFFPTAKERRIKRECDILSPRLSARHEFYFYVKDAEKTCKYVILSIQSVFYKFFCTSMTTGIIIFGFYYYIFSMVLYRKNSVELQDAEGKIIYFSGRWWRFQRCEKWIWKPGMPCVQRYLFTSLHVFPVLSAS